MVVVLLLDDDDGDEKELVRAMEVCLLRVMDSSLLLKKDGARGSSGQDAEGLITEFEECPGGLFEHFSDEDDRGCWSRSGEGEDEGGPSNAPRSERLCSRYWSGILRGKGGGGAWRYDEVFLDCFCFDLSLTFLPPPGRVSSPSPPRLMLIDPFPVFSQPYRSDKVEEALLWNCNGLAAVREEEEGSWCCELERERAGDDVLVLPDLSDPDERRERV